MDCPHAQALTQLGPRGRAMPEVCKKEADHESMIVQNHRVYHYSYLDKHSLSVFACIV